MTDHPTAAMFALILTCLTVYLCFRGIAWVVANGWRSMLGLVALRGEAVIEWQGCDTQDATAVWAGVDRALAVADQVHEQDFSLWENEIGERAQ